MISRYEIDEMFRRLQETSGVLHAFLITSDLNVYASDENMMRNDSVELKIIMKASRFLDSIHEQTKMNFKQGHWAFERQLYSLYAVNNNKLLLVHSEKQNWDKLDDLIVDFLLTL